MIFLSAGELWAAVIGLAAAMGAAWYLLGAVFRIVAARRRTARPATGHRGPSRAAPPPSMPPMTSLPPTAAQTRQMRAGPGSGPPLTAMPPTASQSMAPPMVPVPGVTLTVNPCGCIFYHRDTIREPCPDHARAAAERDEINRLDQQIRQMP